MRRISSRALASLLLGLLGVQLALAGNGILCVSQSAVSAHASEPGNSHPCHGHLLPAPAQRDDNASHRSDKGPNRPSQPLQCQPMAACAAGVVVPNAVVNIPEQFNTARECEYTPYINVLSSVTFPPKSPPPRS